MRILHVDHMVRLEAVAPLQALENIDFGRCFYLPSGAAIARTRRHHSDLPRIERIVARGVRVHQHEVMPPVFESRQLVIEGSDFGPDIG